MALLKPKSKIIKYLSYVFVFIIGTSLAGNFLAPEQANAAGNVYNFQDINVSTNVEVSSSLEGPWTNTNFIRMGRDNAKGFFVRVTISLAGLTNSDGMTFNSDVINFAGTGWGSYFKTNPYITGVGPSFVAKVTQEQVQVIADKVKAGNYNPETDGGVPCYTESVTTGGAAVANAVVIVGAATAAALAGPAILGAGAMSVGGAVGGSAVGATAVGTAAQSVALSVAIGSQSAVVGGVAGAAGGGLIAAFLPVGPSNFVKCDSPFRPSPNEPTSVVPIGGTLYSDTVAVPASAYKNLGLNDGNSGSINEFYVVPDFYFSVWNGLRGNNFLSSLGAGKSVYAQLYTTQAEADAHANDAVPASVPNNGVNTGSGQNVGDKGSPLLSLINGIIGTVLGLMQEVIFGIFFYLIAPIIQAMLSIHVYTDQFVAVIYPGWEIVRNICNILFILALMIIALATLLRVESYQYRHLLVQVILAALLINFSLVIAQAILGVADTVQAQFLPANVTVIRSLAGNLMTGWRGTILDNKTVFNGTFAGTVQPLFWLAMSLGSFAVFCAIAAFLVIRIVALWLLLLISPIAYACGVLPATASYRSQWWQMFLKYAFFTPIMAFFLNLTAVIANTYKTNPILQQINSADLQQSLGGSSLATFVFTVASNLLLLVFLLASLKVADAAGIIGASGITGMAQKGILAPFTAAGGLAKIGGNYLQRIKRDRTKAWSQEDQPWYKKAAFTALNAGSVVKAFKKDSEKNLERAQHEAEAAGLDLKRQVPGFREKNLPSQLAHAQLHYADEISKENPYSGVEALEVKIGRNELELGKKTEKARARAMAKVLQLFEEKGGNALLASYGKNADGSEKFEWSPEGINAWFNDMVKQGSFSAQQAGEMRSRISKLGYATDQTVLYEGVNMHGVHPTLFETYRDNKNQKWEIKGKGDFEGAEDFARVEADKLLGDSGTDEYKLLQKRLIKRDANGVETSLTGQEAIDARNKFKSEVVSNMIGGFGDHKSAYYQKYHGALEKLDVIGEDGKQVKFNSDNFHNYSNWDASMSQAKVNLSKAKDAVGALKNVHWNSMVNENNGITSLQEMAISATQDIKDDALFAGGRGLQAKVLNGLEAALKHEDQVFKSYRDFQIREYRKQGLDPNSADSKRKIEYKVNEQVIRLKAFVRSARDGQIVARNKMKLELDSAITAGKIPADRAIETN